MSLRAAINAKFRDCLVDELAAGKAAGQIELCACFGWPVRDEQGLSTEREGEDGRMMPADGVPA